MKLNVAIQMDHVSTIDIDADSTFVLGLEAERRGYTVWHYTPPELICARYESKLPYSNRAASGELSCPV